MDWNGKREQEMTEEEEEVVGGDVIDAEASSINRRGVLAR